MDPHAERIHDLVLEACAIVEAPAIGDADAMLLEQLRAELLALVPGSCETDACDAARGIVELIDDVLATPETVRLSA